MKLHMMTHGDPHQYGEEHDSSPQDYRGSDHSPYYQVNPISPDYQGQSAYSGKYYEHTMGNGMAPNPYVTTSVACTTHDVTSSTYSECDTSSMSNDDLLSVAEEQLRPLIKKELRYTIQSKRIAKGLPSHVEIEYKVPEPEPETEVTVFKRQRRRERNKIAAAKCRFKKKILSEKLMEESYELENQNQRLKTEVQRLQEERQKLMYILNLHRPTCIVQSPSMSSSPPPEITNSTHASSSSSPSFGASCAHAEASSAKRQRMSQSSRTSSYEDDAICPVTSVFTYPPYTHENQVPVQRSVIVQSNSIVTSTES